MGAGSRLSKQRQMTHRSPRSARSLSQRPVSTRGLLGPRGLSTRARDGPRASGHLEGMRNAGTALHMAGLTAGPGSSRHRPTHTPQSRQLGGECEWGAVAVGQGGRRVTEVLEGEEGTWVTGLW